MTISAVAQGNRRIRDAYLTGENIPVTPTVTCGNGLAPNSWQNSGIHLPFFNAPLNRRI